MIRTLLATTAVAALLSTGAIAQDAAAPAAGSAAPATTETPAAGTEAPAAGTEAPAAGTEGQASAAGDVTATDPVGGEEIDATDVGAQQDAEAGMQTEAWDMSAGYTGVDTDNLASRLIDQPVYSSAGDDAEEIGNVTDLVFNESGQINAVVIGVGGFLGIGEKSVAVDFQSMEFVLAADNTERWVVPTTADALNAAPDFVWEEDTPDDVNAGTMGTEGTMGTGGATGTEGGAMAPAGGAMAPADPAMAPADDGEAADPAVEPATN